MAIYKIFPVKDNTIYSSQVTQNAGIDEILELTTFLSGSSYVTSRIILQFDSNDIITSGGTFNSASLNLYLASASNILSDYSISSYALYQSWSMGNGKAADIPITTEGSGWSKYDGVNNWKTGSFPSNVTCSFTSGKNGGGSWWYNYNPSQSFNYTSDKDISLDVTNIVNAWTSSEITNFGLIVKLPVELEITGSISLKYFSLDTHTIYTPCIHLMVNDYVSTGSLSSLSENFIITSNNKGKYKQDEVINFQLGVRKKFPTRTFQTSSIWTNNYVLDGSSYWQLLDYKTNDIIFDFNEIGTKISKNQTGNYFNLYTKGLFPDRYYKIIIKNINSSNITTFIDNNLIFKIEK